ncbi:MAG: hypothetical protein ACU836_11435 [Gammaproteobacteria bacterium]
MKILQVIVLANTLLFSGVTFAGAHTINGYDVVADALVVRPLSFVGTMVGSVLFAVSAPFTAIANIPAPHKAFDLAAEVLVIKPAQFTFMRPAGEFGFSQNDEAVVYGHDIH